MDPRACAERWLSAWNDGDYDVAELRDAAADYNDWITRGGFPVRGELSVGTYTIWGLSGYPDPDGGPPMSPVQLGDAERNTFVTPSAIGEILDAAA